MIANVEQLDVLVEWMRNHSISEIEKILETKLPGAAVGQDPAETRLFCVKYKQRKINFKTPGALATRGTIFGLDDEGIFRGEVVCLPFFKFFNAKEPLGKKTPFDWTSAKVLTKADGSLIKVFHHSGRWIIATNNTTKASENFSNLFHIAAKNSGLDVEKLDTSRIYVFELVSPANRIIVKYSETKLYHLLTRCCTTWAEIDDDDIGVERPQPIDFKEQISYESVLALANSYSAEENEGFIVVDAFGQRLKVKGEPYLAAHRTVSDASYKLSHDNVSDDEPGLRKNLLKLVLEGNEDDFLALRPDQCEKVADARAMVVCAEEELARNKRTFDKKLKTKKDLALHLANQQEIPSSVQWVFFKNHHKSRLPDIKCLAAIDNKNSLIDYIIKVGAL